MDGVKKIMELARKYVTVEVSTVFFCYTLPLLQFGTQDLLYSKICYSLLQNDTVCMDRRLQRHHKWVESETSLWTIYCNLALILPSVVSAVIQGGYIDRYGIQIPLIVPLSGSFLGFILISVISWTTAHHAYILVAMLVFGMTGHAATIIMAFMAFITKDSSSELRPIRIAVVASSLSIAMTLGVGTFGPMIDNVGISSPFMLGAVSTALGLVDVICRLRPPEHQIIDPKFETHKLTERLCNVLSTESMRNYLSVLAKKREDYKRVYMHLMVAAFILSFCALIGVLDVEFLYLTKEKNFTSTEVSVYMAVGNLLTFTGNIIVVYLLNLKLGLSILYTTIIGSVGSALCYGGLSLAESQTVFWLSNACRLLSGLTAVGARTFISSCVDMSEQGIVMSFIAVVEAIFKLVASLVFNGIYSVTLSMWPGLVLMLAAGFCLLGIVIITAILWHQKRHMVPHRMLDEEEEDIEDVRRPTGFNSAQRRESILPVDEAIIM